MTKQTSEPETRLYDAATLSNFYGKALYDSIKNPSPMLEIMYRAEVLKAIKEYHQLTRWHWRRKRQLEKAIAYGMKYWLKDMEKINDKQSKVKFTRYGNVQ